MMRVFKFLLPIALLLGFFSVPLMSQVVGGGGGAGGGGGDFSNATFNAAFGIAGTPDSQVMSIQGITGGTNVNVNCAAGCAGGTQDADDGSIAAGQTTGIQLAQAQVFDGTVWRRLTIGVAGTASAQVLTVQGIASMTALSVTPTAGDLDIGNVDLEFAGTAAATNAGNTSAQTLRVIEATDSQLSAGVGATSDSAATAGSTGSVNAKLRFLTTQIDTIRQDVVLLTGALTAGSDGFNISEIGGIAPSVELTFDMDSGAGTQTRSAIGIAVAASGGAVLLTGDTTNGLDVDVTRLMGATVRDTGSNDSLNVALTDSTGSQITVGTDYTHDVALTVATTAGPMQMARASAALPTAVSADDDAVILSATRKGAMHIADVDPCGSPSINKSSVPIAAVAADTQLVALSGSTVIYVCGWNFTLTGTTPSYRFWSGTGSVCATSQDNLTGVFLPTAGTLQHAGNGGATVLKANAGEALCIDVGGTPVADGVLTYVQQ